MRSVNLRRFFALTAGLAILTSAAGIVWAAERDAAENAEAAIAAEARLLSSVSLLASDDLEGRGVGTKGLDQAADYIAEQFASLGLKTDLIDGGPFQPFEMSTGAELGDVNRAVLVFAGEGDASTETFELKLGEDFNPLALGGSDEFDAPLVFVGYGITAPNEGYDDYAGIDVKDKAVVILRHEPQQNNPHSAFDGTKDSAYAPLVRKISNAYEHGARAVVFVTDETYLNKRVATRQKLWVNALDKLAEAREKLKAQPVESLDELQKREAEIKEIAEAVVKAGDRMRQEIDPLMKFNQGGSTNEGRDFAVLHVTRKAIDRAIKAASDADLATLEAQIDNGPAPRSFELPGWRIKGQVSIKHKQAMVKNVLAVLEGEGPHADETIVIGAHYDHVGRGGANSLAPGSTEIHNGADDNGSGTASLLEIARMLAARPEKLGRRILFIAFTAEEEGLIGSARYVKEPVIPLDKTVAMLNMDMVGRLKDDKLIIQGTGTAEEFGPVVDRYNEEFGFDLTKQKGGFGPSDHSSFFAKKIPVMHFFTGLHGDYHRPGDDVEKLNVPGMRRVTQMIADIAVELANSEAAPTFVDASGSEHAGGGGGGGDRPYFGSVPDFSEEQPGYALSGVTKDGPAEKAGLKAGDVIIKLGDSQIGNLEDFDSALRKYKGGDKVPVIVKRGEEEVTVEVTLGDPR